MCFEFSDTDQQHHHHREHHDYHQHFLETSATFGEAVHEEEGSSNVI